MSSCSVVCLVLFKKHATIQTFYPVCYLKITYLVTTDFLSPTLSIYRQHSCRFMSPVAHWRLFIIISNLLKCLFLVHQYSILCLLTVTRICLQAVLRRKSTATCVQSPPEQENGFDVVNKTAQTNLFDFLRHLNLGTEP